VIVIHDPENEYAVQMENATLRWDKSQPDPLFKSLNLKIEKGALIGVIGKVGAGKSSLLASIIGDMEVDSGTIKR
jgi:ABC-type bacteriocin/lantibiotic exporter with double-glycine peptidase domain